LNKKCDEIIDVVNNIRQYCEQLTQENSISKNEFEELLADLECKRKELEDMSVIINR
jgi:bacterioferritin (cytochrome b1)